MAEVPNLVREDRADLVLVQALQEAGRDHEFRGRDRPAEDERIRRGVFALPDLRRGDPRLAREFVTVRKSHGFESAVIGWRPRIAQRTIAGETSHWARMKRNARPKTIAKAAGNARLWRT